MRAGLTEHVHNGKDAAVEAIGLLHLIHMLGQRPALAGEVSGEEKPHEFLHTFGVGLLGCGTNDIGDLCLGQ